MATAIKRRYAGWGRKVRGAQRNAVRALRGNATADEVAAAVRGVADAVKAIPPEVRAMEQAMQDCGELVAILSARGFRFASQANAPAQIAAGVYAAWLDCHTAPAADPAEWLNAITLLVDGIAHAADTPDGASQFARDILNAALAREAAT